MIVYQRLEVFHEKYGFEFETPGRCRIGTRIKEMWDSMHPGVQIPIVQSVEKTGTYQVFDYPKDFVTIIDQMIRNVHNEILASREKRRKQAALKNSPTPTKAPNAAQKFTPPNKERKRIPRPVYRPR